MSIYTVNEGYPTIEEHVAFIHLVWLFSNPKLPRETVEEKIQVVLICHILQLDLTYKQ